MLTAKEPTGALAAACVALTELIWEAQLRTGRHSCMLLQQLTEVLQTLTMPRLSLADVQTFGRPCTATRSTGSNLPDA